MLFLIILCINLFYISFSEYNIIIDIPNNVHNYHSTLTSDMNTMICELFNLFDNFPKDEYLDYNEIEVFQYITNPELPLTNKIWKWVCNILHVNPYIGIDIIAFNNSYYHPIRDILGTNINRDYNSVVNSVLNRIQKNIE